MEIDKAIAIASALAKGIDPATGQPLADQKFQRPARSDAKEQKPVRVPAMTKNATVEKYLYQVSEALVRHMADAHRGSDKIESLDDYLARRRKECMPSLRMIGADSDNGWPLVQAHWTIQYWEERAMRAELLLKQRI